MDRSDPSTWALTDEISAEIRTVTERMRQFALQIKEKRPHWIISWSDDWPPKEVRSEITIRNDGWILATFVADAVDDSFTCYPFDDEDLTYVSTVDEAVAECDGNASDLKRRPGRQRSAKWWQFWMRKRIVNENTHARESP